MSTVTHSCPTCGDAHTPLDVGAAMRLMHAAPRLLAELESAHELLRTIEKVPMSSTNKFAIRVRLRRIERAIEHAKGGQS